MITEFCIIVISYLGGSLEYVLVESMITQFKFVEMISFENVFVLNLYSRYNMTVTNVRHMSDIY